MSPSDHAQDPRSYGCTFGCGNPYDYIVVSVADNSTEMLCIPCYVRLAIDMVTAVTDMDDPKVQEAVRMMAGIKIDTVPGPTPKARGKNAPATTTDQDLIDAFDGAITIDDLPEEFL